eukprot:7314586-Prymnesium_polylepis.1
MGMPLQPEGVIHLGQDADRPSGDFDEYQALTGRIHSTGTWQEFLDLVRAPVCADSECGRPSAPTRRSLRTIKLPAPIMLGSISTGSSMRWAVSPQRSLTDTSGNGRNGRVGHLSTTNNIMTYSTSKQPQQPEPPMRLPSTAPI